MRVMHHILGFSLFCALPLVAGGEVSAERAVDVCRQLVEEAREVGRLLRTVSDRESGVAAAADLRTRLEYMRKATEQLGCLPVGGSEEARLFEQMMRDLTHITQGNMPVVQRLVEVNAYGADELIALFQYYKMSSQTSPDLEQSVESPLVHAYTEWCEALEDALFALRRVQNAETAASVASELPALLQKLESKAEKAEGMQSGLSPQQVESERVPVERLQRLREEVRAETQRLRDSGAYGVGAMLGLLDSCVRV